MERNSRVQKRNEVNAKENGIICAKNIIPDRPFLQQSIYNMFQTRFYLFSTIRNHEPNLKMTHR